MGAKVSGWRVRPPFGNQQGSFVVAKPVVLERSKPLHYPSFLECSLSYVKSTYGFIESQLGSHDDTKPAGVTVTFPGFQSQAAGLLGLVVLRRMIGINEGYYCPVLQ